MNSTPAIPQETANALKALRDRLAASVPLPKASQSLLIGTELLLRLDKDHPVLARSLMTYPAALRKEGKLRSFLSNGREEQLRAVAATTLQELEEAGMIDRSSDTAMVGPAYYSRRFLLTSAQTSIVTAAFTGKKVVDGESSVSTVLFGSAASIFCGLIAGMLVKDGIDLDGKMEHAISALGELALQAREADLSRKR